MAEIGETLRETRMRRRIDMTEVEAATKIRAKYLRALENEEWDLLPGPTFVKTFLRTYAEYLELDPADPGRGVPAALRAALDAGSDAVRAGHGRRAPPPAAAAAADRPVHRVLLRGRRAAGRVLPARRRLGRPGRERGARTPWPPPRRRPRPPRRRARARVAQEEEVAAAARLAAADRERPGLRLPGRRDRASRCSTASSSRPASARRPTARSASGRTSATAACA